MVLLWDKRRLFHCELVNVVVCRCDKIWSAFVSHMWTLSSPKQITVSQVCEVGFCESPSSFDRRADKGRA